MPTIIFYLIKTIFSKCPLCVFHANNSCIQYRFQTACFHLLYISPTQYPFYSEWPLGLVLGEVTVKIFIYHNLLSINLSHFIFTYVYMSASVLLSVYPSLTLTLFVSSWGDFYKSFHPKQVGNVTRMLMVTGSEFESEWEDLRLVRIEERSKNITYIIP